MAELTYREAARRIGRSPRSLRRWRGQGMAVRVADDGRVWIDEIVLQQWLRMKLVMNPTWRPLRRTPKLSTDSAR